MVLDSIIGTEGISTDSVACALGYILAAPCMLSQRHVAVSGGLTEAR